MHLLPMHSHPSHSFTYPALSPSPHHHTHPLHTSLTFSTPSHSPTPHIPHILHTTTTTLSTHSSHSPHHHTHPFHKLFLLWGLPVGRNITIPADTTKNIYNKSLKKQQNRKTLSSQPQDSKPPNLLIGGKICHGHHHSTNPPY